MEKAGMYVRLFFKENTTGSVRCGRGERKDTDGMVVDFGNLKKDLKKLCDSFDHSLIYETGSLKAETVAALQNEDFHLEKVSFRPTAENFAYYFYKKLTELGYGVHCVEVYETPNNCAVYEEE